MLQDEKTEKSDGGDTFWTNLQKVSLVLTHQTCDSKVSSLMLTCRLCSWLSSCAMCIL